MTGPSSGGPGRAAASLAARVLVTLGLLLALAWRLDLRALAARVAGLDAGWALLALGVVFAAVAVSAWKWGALLAWRGRELPYARLFRHYLVGLFFNNVLPTTVGGDAVRAWEASRDTGEAPDAVGSVIAERLIAGAALGVTALLGLPFVEPSPRLVALVGAFLVADVLLVGAFLVPRVASGIALALLPRRLGGARDTLAATIAVVQASLRSPRLVGRVLVLSIVFQVLVAVVNACLFEAMGVPVSLASCVVYTPMIFTITMLPVSLSGLGVREAAYATFFGLSGVSETDAVAASLLFFLVVGAASLPGAPLFVLGRRSPALTSRESVTP